MSPVHQSSDIRKASTRKQETTSRNKKRRRDELAEVRCVYVYVCIYRLAGYAQRVQTVDFARRRHGYSRYTLANLRH